MTTERERLEKRHAKELAQLALVESVKNEDLPALGITETPIKVHPHTYLADATVCLERETLPDAIVTAENLNPLALFRSAKGGTAFVPEGCKNEREDEDAVPVGAYAYRIHGLRQHREEKTLFFFVKAPSGRVIRFEISVKNDPDNYREYRVKEIRGGHRVTDCRVVSGCGNWLGRNRFWSTDDQPNEFILYAG